MKRSLLCALVLIVVSGRPGSADDSVERFRNALINYFADHALLPVLVDRGYQVGDVVNRDGVNLWARSAQCFPKLATPHPTPLNLADVVRTEGAGFSFGLWLRQLFSSKVGADLARRIEIRFTDVSIAEVSLLDLRKSLDRTACAEIAPLVDGTVVPSSEANKPFFVVGAVVWGKREARLKFAARADLAAKSQRIVQFAAEANLTANASDDGSVTLASNTVAAIALKPVTVPGLVKLASFSAGLRGGETTEAVRWRAVVCATEDACARQFGSFAEATKSTAVTLSESELDQ